MTTQETFKQFRDDIKAWVTNNLNAIGKFSGKASDITIDPIDGSDSTNAQEEFERLNSDIKPTDSSKLDSNGYATYKKVGHIVEVSVIAYSVSLSSNLSLGILPEGYRPREVKRIPNYNGAGFLSLDAYGDVTFHLGGASTFSSGNIILTATYILD